MTNRKTPRAGIIGFPVAHSRSPIIHGYWLKHLGLDGAYDRYPVEPQDLERFIQTMPENGLVGCNVTIPHKENAMRLCAHLTDRARGLGAVNTLWFENGVLHGENTDVPGFMSNLDACVPGWKDRVRKAVVLGAGGAARAIIYGLAERGLERIEIINRHKDRAETLIASLAPAVKPFGALLSAGDWDKRATLLAGADLLVNTTSLGMKGYPPQDIDLSGLHEGAVVADIVYTPLMTDLLARAKARGLATADGLGMLLHQATPGFEKWFGKKPQVTPELRALVEADIPKV